MRLLRVIPSMNPRTGGPCQGIRNSIPELERLGVQNEVVCFDEPNAEFLKKDTFLIHPLGPAQGPYAYCPLLSSWISSNIHRFDAVIIHGIWLYSSYGTFRTIYKFRKGSQRKPKIFVMPHGMLDPYFQKAKSRRMKALRNWIFWKLIEHRTVNGADALLFTCEQEMLLAREPFSPYSPKKEINIGYGVQNPPPFSQEFQNEFYSRFPVLREKPFFLFLSRIHPKKGVDILLKAYTKLKNELKEIPALVIAGPGLESPYGKSLRELVNDDSVIFSGMLEGPMKWGAFYACEAFVLPSHQENFGIAVVEAMACRKAVLISDQVNIFIEIEKGQAGIISTDTLSGIYNAMKKWIGFASDEKYQMGENAYSVYNSRYTVETAASRMLSVLIETQEDQIS